MRSSCAPRAFKAERDPAVELTPTVVEDFGTIRLHNVYVRYLLPLMIEVQYYEGVECGSRDARAPARCAR